MKNKNIYISVLIYILSVSGVYYYVEQDKKARIDSVLEKSLNTIETHYRDFIYDRQNLADMINEQTVQDPKVIEILSDAYNFQQDTEKLNILRNTLYKHLEKNYAIYKTNSVLQYHFVFPNNVTFLRMHNPKKFGDNLSKVRKDFNYVNRTLLPISGFMQGRSAHSFRNAYPVFDKDKNHIGAMEASYSSDLLQDYLNNISKVDSHFLVHKDVVSVKSFKKKDSLAKYVQSPEHKDYMVVVNKNNLTTTSEVTIVESVKKSIQKKMPDGKKFAEYYFDNSKLKVAAFYPVKESITDNVVAWIVAYNNSKVIESVLSDSVVVKTVFALFLFIVLLAFNKVLIHSREANEYKERFELAFDGINDGLWDWDVVNGFAYFSYNWKKMLGYEDDDLENTAETFFKLIHDDDKERVQNLVNEHFKNPEETIYSVEVRMLCKDGTYKWILARGKARLDASGKPIRMVGSHTDISEEIELKNEIMSERNFVSNIIDSANAVIAVIDSNGVMTRMNHYAEEFSGYTKEELSSEPYFWKCLLPEEVRGGVIDIIENAKKGNITKSYQNEWISKSGEHRMFEWSNTLVLNDDGSMNHIATIGIDITDNIKNQERMKKAAEIANLGFSELDVATMTFELDETWFNMIGTTAEAEGGKFIAVKEVFAKYIPSSSHVLINEKIAKAIERGYSHKDSLEHQLIHKNGNIIDIVVFYKIIFQDGNAVRFTGVSTDITNLKKQEREIIKAKQEAELLSLEQSNLLSLFDKGDSVLFKWNNDDTWSVNYASQSVSRLLGYSVEDFMSSKILYSDCIHKDDLEQVYSEVNSAIEYNLDFFKHNPYRIITKDGSVKWVLDYTVSQKDKDGRVTHFIGYITDITEQKNINKELEKAKESAEYANKAKSDFLANMSHEIRTPLNAILGFIELLKEKERNKESINYLNIINSSSNDLLNLINDILDFSKIESGNLSIESIDFDPFREFQVTKKLFHAKMQEKNIQLFSSYAELPKSLNGDILRIKQVVNNLLSNAMKFTHENKNIFLDITYEDGCLNVHVKDEGIGISKEYQDKIFDAFTQEDSTTTRKYGGTGLGLSISYNLIKMMGGEIKLKSELGKGSEFYFSIPLKTGKDIDVIEIDTIEVKKDLKGHVLLVEDNKANQMFMKVILKKLHLTYDIAEDGVEAVETYKKSTYDVILMDENMPNMSGIEATRQILEYEKENNIKHVPVVALTANALKGDREKFLDAGMDEYLTKPVNKKELERVLSEFL